MRSFQPPFFKNGRLYFFNFSFLRKPDVLALFWCIICLVLRDWNMWKLHINLTPQNYLFLVVLKVLTHLFRMHPFFTPWKHQKTIRFSDVFKMQGKDALGRNELIFHKNFRLVSTTWKVSKYEVFSGLYFPVFGLNTEIYRENLHFQSKYMKTQIRKNSVFGHYSRSAHPTAIINTKALETTILNQN